MAGRVVERGRGNVSSLLRQLTGRGRAAIVTVGIHSDEGAAKKKTWETVVRKNRQTQEFYLARKRKDADMSLIEVAVAHEFGIGVPRRSFVADWVDENEQDVRKKLQLAAGAALKGRSSVQVAVARLGAWSAGQMKRRVIAGISPALSKRRLAEKAVVNAKSTPLIFTAQLLSSIMSKPGK